MCGRFQFTDDIAELRQMAGEANERLFGEVVKTGEIFPTDLAVVAIWKDNQVKYFPMRWGFPKWDGKGVVINARAETAAEKPMFRESLLKRRCAVPSAGFYEWNRVDGKAMKEKYLFAEPDQEITFMAGIFDTFTKDDGSRYDAFTILTTAANDSVEPIHDRMPVILQHDELEAWLRDGDFMQTVLDRVGPALEMKVETPLKEAEYKQTSLFGD